MIQSILILATGAPHCASTPKFAGTFSVLTYNIAGLPERPSSGLPQASVDRGRIFCARLTSALGRTISADVPIAEGVTDEEPTGWTALSER